MTEAEWLACEDPQKMLEFLHEYAVDRELRLFACACCRRIWHLFPDEPDRAAIEVAEQYVDGQVEHRALSPFHHDFKERLRQADRYAPLDCALFFTTNHMMTTHDFDTGRYIPAAAAESAVDSAGDAVAEAREQARLLRDIFGYLFYRPAAFDPQWPRGPFDPAWRTGTATVLAKQMYESRDFGAMPILADALQDAGCDTTEILDHCRGPGPHVRGCWVVDLVLDKG